MHNFTMRHQKHGRHENSNLKLHMKLNECNGSRTPAPQFANHANTVP